MSPDILLTLGGAVVGLIAFAVVVGRWKAGNAAMAAAGRFQAKGLEAKIDRARHNVQISVESHARIFSAPLGHLVVEHKVETVTLAHEKLPKRRCRITLTSERCRLLATGRYVASRDWAETTWTAVETGKTWVRLRAVCLPAYYAQHWASGEVRQARVQTDMMDLSLSNTKARAFKLWLDRHQRELFPDRAAVRAAWDQACAELLRACRQQRDYRQSAAEVFETWVFSAQPAIAYLVIEADGAAFWASGDTPMLEEVERPQFKLAGDKLILSSGDDQRSFPVPSDRRAVLQALRRRGMVRMC